VAGQAASAAGEQATQSLAAGAPGAANTPEPGAEGPQASAADSIAPIGGEA